MEVIYKEDLIQFVGGSGGYNSSGGYGSYVFSDCNNYGIPSDCVFQCMAQISSFYGDSSLSLNSMMTNYDSLYAGAISSGYICSSTYGVNDSVFANFVDQYFNRSYLTSTNQLDSFIQGGNNFAIGVIEKVSSNGTIFYHAVVLTGMTDDCDPQAHNTTGYIDKNCILDVAAITGRCH